MLTLSRNEIAQALGCAQTNTDALTAITRVVTDSRQAGPGALFVAIAGERLDGNRFAKAALEQGAVAAVVSHLAPDVDAAKVFLVPDTKKAHIQIGKLFRDRFEIPFVGVTGSVGKTTTKELIHCVLSANYHTHKNEGNRNNEIGVPETLFALTTAHQAAVIEMGMSGLGEIHDLSLAVRPAIGVITNIGLSHLEALGSRENILKAKLELTDGMASGAPLLLNGDDDLLNTVQNLPYPLYRYGIVNPACQIRALHICTQSGQTSFTILSPWGSHVACIPTIGEHNVLNALAAFGVGCLLGVEPTAAVKALSSYTPAGMRQRQVAWQGRVIMEDCYNSAPDSLKAAAYALCQFPAAGRRILVLSDMLELGPTERELHQQAGTRISTLPIDALYGCGSLTKVLIDACTLPEKQHFESKEKLAAFLLTATLPDDLIWFKASRGMALEDVLQRMYEKEIAE